MHRQHAHFLASLLGLAVGAASFVFLVIQGIPGEEAAIPGKRSKIVHTTRSGCPTRCTEPERVETEVSLESSPAAQADEPSLIEKAIDNDIGVQMIRLLAALLIASATAATLERLLRRPDDAAPPEPDKSVKPAPKDDSDSGGSKQGEDEDTRIETAEMTGTGARPSQEEEEANARAEEHRRVEEKQAQVREQSYKDGVKRRLRW